MDEKRCPRCEQTKSIQHFYQLKSGPRKGTIQGWCKSCRNEIRRLRYAEDEVMQAKQRAISARWYTNNRERAAAARRAYHQRTKVERNRQSREGRWRRVYGLSAGEYEALLFQQGGMCAVCGGPQQHGWSHFCVDHRHSDGQVRGLLCDFCNRAVGLLKDDPDRALRMAKYLQGAQT